MANVGRRKSSDKSLQWVTVQLPRYINNGENKKLKINWSVNQGNNHGDKSDDRNKCRAYESSNVSRVVIILISKHNLSNLSN